MLVAVMGVRLVFVQVVVTMTVSVAMPVVIVIVIVVVVVVVVVDLPGRRGRRAQFHFKGSVQGAQGRRRPRARVLVSMAMVPVGLRHGGS